MGLEPFTSTRPTSRGDRPVRKVLLTPWWSTLKVSLESPVTRQSTVGGRTRTIRVVMSGHSPDRHWTVAVRPLDPATTSAFTAMNSIRPRPGRRGRPTAIVVAAPDASTTPPASLHSECNGKAVVPVTEPASHSQAPTLQPDTPPVPAPSAVARRPHRLPRSRAGGLWTVLVVFAVVLLLLMIFILQNGQRSDVHFLGAHGHLPMGVALLLSAIFGVLLVAVPTVVRVLQLRLMASRHGGRIGAAQAAARKPAGS